MTTPLYLYGEIGFVVTDQYVADFLSSHPEPIDVHISSIGGDWIQGIAIYNLLRQHGERYAVATYCDSMAASVASVIFLAGKHRYMLPNTYLMVHNVYSEVWGQFDAQRLREQADLQDKLLDDLITIYLSHWTGHTEQSLKELLQTDTYLDADDAVTAGLATAILELAVANCARAMNRTALLTNGRKKVPTAVLVNTLRGISKRASIRSVNRRK